MRFKVGDLVKIKSLGWYNANKDEYGYINCGSRAFFTKMSDLCGKIATIKEICKTNCYRLEEYDFDWTDEMIEGLVEEETKPKDMGEVSDGYHSFNELYEYRMLYNAALFNEFAKQGLYDVHKSRKHADGEFPFGDQNWFIVMAELPTGQISNHYEMKDWDKFQIPEKPLANKWDGHTPKDVAERLTSFTNPKKEYPKTYVECYSVLGYEPDEDVVSCYRGKLIESFVKLLICRDAYWKLYGKEIGLGKLWSPDLTDNVNKHCIEFRDRGVYKVTYSYTSRIFAFPTKEMRDAFYENFKEEIEQCKELL